MKSKSSVPFITGGIRDRDRMTLRYATLVALGNEASESDKEEMSLIEDHLHRTRDSILRHATDLALRRIDRRHLSPLQRENLKKAGHAFREGMEEIESHRKLH